MTDNNILIARLQEGDSRALDELAAENMALVRHVALRFRDRGTEYEDLVQIGAIGLVKAARSFDFSYGCVFSTYAVPLIIGEIKRYLRDDGMIKVSRGMKAKGCSVMRVREDFIKAKAREPRLSELAELCQMSVEELSQALDAISPIHSLSESVGDEGSTLESFIAEKESELDKVTDRVALSEAISRLSPLHRQIIRLRYYDCLSQQKVGTIMGLSQVKVSREEKKILEELRRHLP